ncbi:[Fe-Fe] hydrogenase large subunit C-terminal domain-containing protein [Desulforamulus ruminis]|uniref:Fe-S cluster domain protein n=1 Tax=Desulforamulus ruminis (strain ATCC 23193 / DSM 2154 / NCIMB 8452 / DL) TaxID=696281 RepID=F6DQ65_DESRL|nr:[Fe-Fe] hydrogenase large subunit C-terminal domain-containing protein [Desulforamulus ruminis]AEG59643.1 Fe-S cluster domain protein [Desulforamulus ruminis DSM 2154]
MALIYTDHNSCRKCYACVRACPVKTISIKKGLPEIVEEGCIGCGRCVLACSIGAKMVHDDSSVIQQWISEGQKLAAIVAPSYPAAYDVPPEKFVGALYELGFANIQEVAYGAEICAQEYTKFFNQQKPKTILSTPCPAVVQLVEKHMPSMIEYLAPIDSPMLIQAKLVRARYPDHKIVFIGPCLSKKYEASDTNNQGYVDAVITFRQLNQWFELKHVSLEDVREGQWDNPQPQLSRTFPISGGLLKSSGIVEDVASMEIVVVEGARRCIEVLKAIEREEFAPRFIDMLMCEGCVMGPGMVSDKSYVVRAHKVATTVRRHNNRLDAQALSKLVQEMDFHRKFTAQPVVKKQYNDEEVWQMLKETGKHTPRDLINCSACGYDTCWEKAVACLQGLAEKEMCLPFLLSQVPALTNSLMDMSNKLMLSMESINFSTLTLKGTTSRMNLKNQQLETLLEETNRIAKNTLQLSDTVLAMLARYEQPLNSSGTSLRLNSSGVSEIKEIASQSKQQAEKTTKAFEEITGILNCLREDSVSILEQEKAIKVVTHSLEQIVSTYEQLLNIGVAMANIGRNYV